MSEDGIEVFEIIRILKNKWKMIVIVSLITTIISSALSLFFITPIYQSTAKVFIGKADTNKAVYNSSDINMYQKLTKSYTELITTSDIVENAIENNDLNIDAEEVMSGLKAESTDESQIITIKYLNKDNVLAKKVLDAVTKEFIKKSNELVPYGNVEIIEESKLAVYPVNINIGRNILLGLMAGIIIASAGLIIWDYFKGTFKSKDQVEGAVNVPVIGVIPLVDMRKKKKTRFVEEEFYRTLRTNIQHSSNSRNTRVLLVTSADSKEGKSTVSSRMAMAFAQNGQSVVLLDCDLRKPTLHRKFNVSNEFGLTDIIKGNMKIEDVIMDCGSNIDLIASGKSVYNPSEVLDGDDMKNILEYLKEEYDIIIIDSPPITAVTDAQILSTEAEGTILVVRAEETKSDTVADALDLLKQVEANVIGIVLNGVYDYKNKYDSYYYGK